MQGTTLPTIIVDNADPAVRLEGGWLVSSRRPDRYGPDYLHDDNSAKGERLALFPLTVRVTGSYELHLFWNASPDRASNVPLRVEHADGVTELQLDQQQPGGDWRSLGVYPFVEGGPGSLAISNAGTDGYVIVDAVRLVLQV